MSGNRGVPPAPTDRQQSVLARLRSTYPDLRTLGTLAEGGVIVTYTSKARSVVRLCVDRAGETRIA